VKFLFPTRQDPYELGEIAIEGENPAADSSEIAALPASYAPQLAATPDRTLTLTMQGGAMGGRHDGGGEPERLRPRAAGRRAATPPSYGHRRATGYLPRDGAPLRAAPRAPTGGLDAAPMRPRPPCPAATRPTASRPTASRIDRARPTRSLLDPSAPA